MTTPEKLDSITRRWCEFREDLRTIKLLMIDEVHMIRGGRGPTVEAVISRLKTFLGGSLRIVAVSASISNTVDFCKWYALKAERVGCQGQITRRRRVSASGRR